MRRCFFFMLFFYIYNPVNDIAKQNGVAQKAIVHYSYQWDTF